MSWPSELLSLSTLGGLRWQSDLGPVGEVNGRLQGVTLPGCVVMVVLGDIE